MELKKVYVVKVAIEERWLDEDDNVEDYEEIPFDCSDAGEFDSLEAAEGLAAKLLEGRIN
jgi:hypothetical protein